MGSTAPTERPSQVILFSIGRTACHLLERVLSKQPDTDYLIHPMIPARLPHQINMLKEDSIAEGIKLELRANYTTKVEEAVAVWQSALKEAQQSNKILFIHEHPVFCLNPDDSLQYITHQFPTGTKLPPTTATNPTLLPSILILTPGTRVIMTLRHPAWVMPAAYHAITNLEMSGNKSNILNVTNYGFHSQLYNYFVEHGITPIVAEAEDYMSSQDFTRKLAAEAGLDSTACSFEWETMSEEDQKEQHPMYIKLQQTLIHSTGLVPGKVKAPPVIEEEEKGWKEKFGEEGAAFVREMVEWAMPDYEYLRERKLRLS